MVESSLYFNSIAVPVWFLKLTLAWNITADLSHWDALWPCFRHPQQWILGHIASRWDDDRHLQYFYPIIALSDTSLKWWRNSFWDVWISSSMFVVTKFYHEPKPCSCLLAFWILLWLAWLLTQSIAIAWTTQKALLFCSKIRYSKHWLFILLLINFV